nr:NeuD/PglB/VioB family sugar acetyltransferase [Chiayiivirga flava]
MKRVAILGAGDLGLQIAHHLADADGLRCAGFFDDTRTAGEEVFGLPVLGPLAEVRACHGDGAFDALLIGIGYRHMALRNRLYAELSPHIPFATLVHPSAHVDRTCRVGHGTVVYPGCVLDQHASIGANVLLNIGCVVAHHSSVGAGSFLSPAVKIAGFVHVDAGVTLGLGTAVIDNVTIASGVRTGAGAVVIGNLVEPGLYVGVPARLKRTDA